MIFTDPQLATEQQLLDLYRDSFFFAICFVDNEVKLIQHKTAQTSLAEFAGKP